MKAETKELINQHEQDEEAQKPKVVKKTKKAKATPVVQDTDAGKKAAEKAQKLIEQEEAKAKKAEEKAREKAEKQAERDRAKAEKDAEKGKEKAAKAGKAAADKAERERVAEVKRKAREEEAAEKARLAAMAKAERDAANEPKPCLCGCGGYAAPRRTFIQGHDARFKSMVMKHARGEEVELPDSVRQMIDGNHPEVERITRYLFVGLAGNNS